MLVNVKGEAESALTLGRGRWTGGGAVLWAGAGVKGGGGSIVCVLG